MTYSGSLRARRPWLGAWG